MSDDNTILSREGDLAEQFDDMAQQAEAGALGMWLFLGTELLLFGGLFTGYISYRLYYWEGFHEASRHLYFTLGSINTAVLLTSSYFVARAVGAARQDKTREIAKWLLIALALGAIFLCIKSTEYYLEWREHLVPWLNFQFEGAKPHHAQLFFVFYFLMTGLHAVHMIVGMTLLLIVAFLAWRGRFSARYHNPVELVGLYWHFVDIVWVFLYPALYLLNPHS